MITVFQYVLMPESELRGRRWVAVGTDGYGKLVSPFRYTVHRVYLIAHIWFLKQRLVIRRRIGNLRMKYHWKLK